MNCPSCSSALDTTHPVCRACDTALEMLCDSCTQRWPLGAAFCAGCGTRLVTVVAVGPSAAPAIDPFGGQRRVVTIVMSDLSGYTAMCERFDPELISDIMGTIKRTGTEIIESFGGTVNQFKGDEIVSLFGLPTAGEDDARRAVSAALALHHWVDELNRTLEPAPPVPLGLHSGIHTGLLIVETLDSRDGVYGLTGDAINTTARILGISQRGELIIGPTTRDAVAPYFEIESAGVHTMRNKAEPVPVFRVLRELGDRSRFDAARERGLTALSGRDGELARLGAAFDECASGAGRILVIEAEAGAGKSRLAYEFGQRARERSHDVTLVAGRCQAFGETISHLPFVHVVRSILDLDSAASVEDVVATVPTAVAAIDPALGRFTPAYLVLLSALSAKEVPAEWQGDSLPGFLQDAIVELVAAVARRGPTIVQLDDWHWADEASHAVLQRIHEEIGAIPALVTVSQRPGAPAIARDVDVIELGPLSAAATEAMIAGWFGAASVRADLATRIQSRTLGNPFFVEEVCAALHGQGRARIAADLVLLVDDLDDLVIPDTVQAVVLSRVDNLEPDTRAVLKMASVIGREFTVGLLRRLTDPTELIGHITRLHELGFIEPRQRDDADTGVVDHYRFRHIITQEVTYETLLMRERKIAHGRIAEVIETGQSAADVDQRRMVEALAHHHHRAGNSEKALGYFELAGETAMERRALFAARRHLRSAIDESFSVAQTPEVRARRGRLTLRWASACIFLPSASQIELLETVQKEALADANHHTAVLANYWINWIHYSTGNQLAAEAGTRALLELVEPAGDRATTGLLQCHLGQVLFSQARLDEADAMLRAGLERPKGSSASSSSARQNVSGLYCYSMAQLALVRAARGDADGARTTIDEAMALVRGTNERATEASLGVCASIVALYLEDWQLAIDRIDAIAELPEASVSPHVRTVSAVHRGYALFRLGREDEGLRSLRRGVALHEQSEGQLSLGLCLGYLADALLRAGAKDEAREVAGRAIASGARGDVLGRELSERVLGEAESLPGGHR